jgi:Tol biopolymer transport system component
MNMRISFLIWFLLLAGCVPATQNVLLTPSVTRTIQNTLLPSFTKNISTPIYKPALTSTQEMLFSTDQLSNGQYLLVRDNYSQSANYSLYVVELKGKVLGKLLSGYDFLNPSVSPDNQWLVFADSGGELTENSIHIYNLKEKTDVTLVSGCSTPSASSWSPDGISFAVACKDILIFSLVDGKWVQQGSIPVPDQLRNLPLGVVNAIRLSSPAWSPDGEKIAFVAPVETRDYGPYIVKASCAKNPIDCVYQDTKILQTDANLIWSSDPSILGVEIPYSNVFELYDTNTGIKVKTYLLGAIDDQVGQIAWLPDKELIAFKPDQEGKIYILNTKDNKIEEIYKGHNDIALIALINVTKP